MDLKWEKTINGCFPNGEKNVFNTVAHTLQEEQEQSLLGFGVWRHAT